MKMKQIPGDDDRSNVQGTCEECKAQVFRYRGQGDIHCDCGAHYNAFGQRLRDDLLTRVNPSSHDEDIGDLEGDELSYLASEGYDEMHELDPEDNQAWNDHFNSLEERPS